MASPHPHYPQPGPSSIPYPPPPPPYAFGGNPPYQHSHQPPPNVALSPPPPGLANGAGRAAYPHQGPGRPTAFHPHFLPRQPYQPAFYHPMEHPHHPQPPQSPYQQQRLVNGAPLDRPPSGPLRQGQFIHATPQRPPVPHFSPSFHPHNHSYPHSSPNSPSVFPKQLLMPPTSPLQSHILPEISTLEVQPDQPPPFEPQQSAEPAVSTSGPISPVLQSSSQAQPFPSLPQGLVSRETSPSSMIPSGSTLSSVREASEPLQAFPDRTNVIKGLALQSRRPPVMNAVPFTVSSAARPPLSFYDTLTILEEVKTKPSRSPQTNNLPLTPPPDVIGLADSLDEPDSPPQQSLGSSATTITTPATSTAPHTPTPGSPHSSMTSVSLPPKSPSEVLREASPSPSVAAVATGPSAHDTGSAEHPVIQRSITPSATTPPPVKKSWASLLRSPSNGPSNSGGLIGSNGLPTSSVQGFSIPASFSAVPAAQHGLFTKSDFFTLLTASNSLVSQMPPVRTRGIVNLGNMCFANTVLQVLVYCPPFHKLFTELNKHMPGPNVKENRRVDAAGTPLVNAT